jgi:hypothetical protein
MQCASGCPKQAISPRDQKRRILDRDFVAQALSQTPMVNVVRPNDPKVADIDPERKVAVWTPITGRRIIE